jgi:mRNA interferase YafQ
MMKRHLPIEKLQAIVEKLRNGEELPPTNRDHALTGNWANHRECHIAPDWLLIYQIHDDILILELTRTGSHSDLF